MRVKELCIVALLMVALSAGVASFTMPSLLGKPMMPTLMAPAILDTTMMPTPEDVSARTAAETFTLTISGNVYVDKLPVSGAVVTVYLNGRQVGQTTAGDLYQFSVPGVKIGDTVRVDASYEGHTGTATEQVKFKSMNLNVQIKSGRSFIRNALEMLPKKDSLSESQQPAQQTAQPTTPSATTPSTGGATTSTADANALTSQIWSDTSKMLGSTLGQTQNAFGAQPSTSTVSPANAGNLQVTNLDDAMKIAGLSGLPF